ncbi:type I-F CRISPR-associated endoribonuclease Cas6/Csy4 [Psychrobacter sp. H8-1]|uniref:type I-F CRISPR-associated endoribonuclease Cas6/Csy4 n=1 Tax=Psychrobacter sp. H8-1 TaxID=2774129 RepID=UPI00191A668F|nr:type I-F CRISPR-associated endoribonuclease Cas6/Csy4 [Psychrobacter sp. H8-1]
MNYYQEVTLIDGDKKLYELWSDVYNQIHIALAEAKNKHDINTIGVSFPSYRYEEKGDKVFATLGDKLRVFAQSQKDLETLDLDKWLERLTDYVHVKRINEVGDKAKGHVVIRRYRHKNVLKQAEAFAEHKGITLEAALIHCAKHKQDNKPYPYINLRSISNNQPYALSIIQEMTDNETQGSFNSYGINNAADKVTVPHW